MENVTVGQLTVVTYREGGDTVWDYGVVESIFDEQIHILKEKGGRFIDLCNDATSKTIEVFYLTSEGEPVLSGKNIFGRYNFKPKKLDK